MFLIRVVLAVDLDLITLSLDRSGADIEPKLYCWFFLKVFR
jgi:hypothetical protein